MRSMLLLAATLGLAAAAPPAPAPGAVGKPLPEVELEDFTQTEATSIDDYFGRAILIEFFAYWWGPCKSSVPHLNELQEQFGDKGLSVVGVTSESQSLTEPWVEDTGMKYAYAYDKGAKLMGKVGATGYPSAVLVDPSGNVAWMGHPSSLNASIVEPVLEGALAKPLWEWPKEADKVAKALKKRALGDALGEAIELGEGGTQIRATIEKLIAGKLASLKAARDEGDWLRVDTLGDELEDSFKGLPQREEVEVIVDALKKDKEAQDILKAQRKVAKIFSDDIKRKQIDKFEKDLTKIVEDYSGTAAERDARAGLEELEKLRRAYANR